MSGQISTALFSPFFKLTQPSSSAHQTASRVARGYYYDYDDYYYYHYHMITIVIDILIVIIISIIILINILVVEVASSFSPAQQERPLASIRMRRASPGIEGRSSVSPAQQDRRIV